MTLHWVDWALDSDRIEGPIVGSPRNHSSSKYLNYGPFREISSEGSEGYGRYCAIQSAGDNKPWKFQVHEWTSKIRKESLQLDRQIRSIQREEEKVKRTMKQAAQKGDRDTCTILAKEIIRSRKAVNRIYTSKAHMSSVQLQMKNQLATLRVAGSLQKSTEVMSAMQRLVRLPEIGAVMQEMSKEMMKAGIIEEMMEDTFESMEDTEEMEEAAQAEVDKVLWELTEGKLGEAPLPPVASVRDPEASTSKVPQRQAVAEAEVGDEEDEEDLKEMQNRLEALRS